MSFEKDITNCVETLRRGGVIVYPTDTIWGIGCDATSDTAVQRIYAIKQRSVSKSMIVLMRDDGMLKEHVPQKNKSVEAFIQKNDQPVTVIYPDVRNLSKYVIHSDDTAGIRIPKEKFCHALLSAFGKPIVSTSANISGSPTPFIFSEIDARILTQADYVVEYRRNEKVPGKPSTIIRSNDDESITFIRS